MARRPVKRQDAPWLPIRPADELDEPLSTEARWMLAGVVSAIFLGGTLFGLAVRSVI